jgi:hypothetical protein
MENVLFIVPRVDGDSKTIAIVSAQVDEVKLTNEQEFFVALMEAMIDWVNKTADGKKAWERSSEDFNVGDLSAEQPFSHLLKKHLQRHGIFNMKTNPGYWKFDDVLVDKQRLT